MRNADKAVTHASTSTPLLALPIIVRLWESECGADKREWNWPLQTDRSRKERKRGGERGCGEFFPQTKYVVVNMLWVPDSMFFPSGEKWLKTHLLVKSNNGHEHNFRRVTPGLTRAHEHYFLKGPAANHTQRLQINLISIFKAYQPRWYPLHESYLSIQDLSFFPYVF